MRLHIRRPLVLCALVVAVALALLGCSRSTKSDPNWAVTGTFAVTVPAANGQQVTTMRGVQGQYGFIDVPLVAGGTQKCMWHFWGKPEDFVGKTLEVTAVNQEGKTVKVLSGTLAGPNNTAVAHMPSSMSLPSAGLWRLELKVGDKVVGHIIVDVKTAG